MLAIAAAYAGTGRIRTRLGALLDAVRWRLAAAAVAGRWPPWPRSPRASSPCAGRRRRPPSRSALAAFVGFVIGADRAARRPRLRRLGPRRLEPVSSAPPDASPSGSPRASPLVSVSILFGGLAFVRAVAGARTSAPPDDGLESAATAASSCAIAGSTKSSSPAPTTRWPPARENWLAARQTGGIGAQLAAGVRAFLIDLHYGGRSDRIASAPTSAQRVGHGSARCRLKLGGARGRRGRRWSYLGVRRRRTVRCTSATSTASSGATPGRRRLPRHPRLPAGEPQRGHHPGARGPRRRRRRDAGARAWRPRRAGAGVVAGRAAADAGRDDRAAAQRRRPRRGGGRRRTVVPAGVRHAAGDAVRVRRTPATSPAPGARDVRQPAAPRQPLADRRPAEPRSRRRGQRRRGAAPARRRVRRASVAGRTSSPSTSTPTATCSRSSTSSTASSTHPRTDPEAAGRLAGPWRPSER